MVHAACKKDETSGETLVFCHSEAKQASEESWQTLVQRKFEIHLEKISSGLSKKNYTKDFRIISERIGRLKERYSRIAQFYTIDLNVDSNKRVTSIAWQFNEKEALNRFDGGYCLRVHGLDWTCQRLWETYIMLTKAEDGFRSLKSHLGVRPVFHSKESRAEGHLFITLLAYHVMRSIQYQLEDKGIFLSWKKIRQLMSTHVRTTISFMTKDNRKIHIRATSNPEASHKQIYSALDLSSKPGKRIKTTF